MALTWVEQMAIDQSLRDFVEAEIARAGIALVTAQANAEHWRTVSMRLDEKLSRLTNEKASGQGKTSARTLRR